jgi:hypothetical protein
MTTPVPRFSRMTTSPPDGDISEILPNLFLGRCSNLCLSLFFGRAGTKLIGCPSEAGARNLALLRSREITQILSMIPDPILPESDEDEDGIQRMQISVQDWPDQARLFVIISRTLLGFNDDPFQGGEGIY